MVLLIACFVIALFIYFAVYYEKDKKAMEQRGKARNRRNQEDYIIFPFLEEHLIKRPNKEFPTFDMEALQCFSVREMYGEKGSEYGKKGGKVLNEEERYELYGDEERSAKWNPLSQIEEERYVKELKDLKEYRDTIQQHKNMEDEAPGSSDIDPELLKEAKKAVNRFLKEYEKKLYFGNVIYERKEMFKKEQQRVAKSIERAVKEIKKYDDAAYQHFLGALRPINTTVQCYKTDEDISWETK